MALVEGYFDESGDFDESPKLFCVAGYFIEADAARAMDQRWGEVLRKHNIPYFHMVDCAHKVGVFEHMEREETVEIERKLIDLIKEYTLSGFAAFAHAEHFEVSEKHPDNYSSCVEGCVAALRTFMEVSRIGGDTAYFFEQGHKNKGRAYNHVANRLGTADSITFGHKEKIRLLQAADLLAWQGTKYAKDRMAGTRPPRKDFMCLMEHKHMFAYTTVKDGKSSIGYEAWPLSERSAETFSLTLGPDDFPIHIFYENGNRALPIIPIGETHGWRLSGGRLALIRCVALGKKEFALAFDEPRLCEAINQLIGAMELYAGGNLAPAMHATQLDVKVVEGEGYLRAMTPNNAKFVLQVPASVLRILREQLAGMDLGDD